MWPFIGRDEELASAVDALLAPDSFGVVIVGDAGVGKSRLASEAMQAFSRSRPRTRLIRCAATRATATIPFGAVADLVASTAASTESPVRVLHAVAQSFDRRDEDSPAIVELDDAHLADDASAALLHHLVARRRVKSVVTLRAGIAPPDAITALWKDGHCLRLDIASLSREHVERLLFACRGARAEAETAARLWDLSIGNLLFLHELVNDADARGSIRQLTGAWRWTGPVEATGRLADVVAAAIGPLSDSERLGAGLLAFGAPVGLVALEDMTGRGSVASLLDRRVAQVETDDRRQQVTLAHPLYGEVLRSTAGPGERRALLRVLALDLKERSPKRSTDAARLATWAIGGGVQLAHDTLEHAAEEAYRAGDAELAERIARTDPGWRVHATGFILGAALGNQGRYGEALSVLAETAAAPLSEELLARIAYFRMEILSRWMDRLDEAADIFAAAMRDLTDPVWRDLVAAAWAPTLAEHGRIEEALAVLGPMSESPVDRTRIAAVRGLAYIDVPAGRTARTISSADDLLAPALAMPAEWTYGLFDVAGARIISLLVEGRLGEAAAMLGLVGKLSDSVTGAEARPFAEALLGRLALFQGRPRTAIAHLREAAAGFGRLNYGVRKAWALRLAGECHALLGQDAAADTSLSEASRAARLATDPFESDGARATAWVPACRGNVAEARQSLLGEATAAGQSGRHAFEAMLLHDAARLGGAPEVVDRLAELVDVVDGPIVHVYAEHARGLVAADGATLDAASERFRVLGFGLVAAEAAMAASRAHASVGLRARAAASASRASALRADCEGATTPSLALGDGAITLTRREREIAAFAARGYASKDIAGALGRSVRTVDNHLQRAFVKLGIARREDLAGVLGLGEQKSE